jgi:acyl carrier protein
MAEILEDRVRRIVVEQLGSSEEEVMLKSKLNEDLGADPIDLVELVIDLEEIFEIAEIDDGDAQKFVTVQDLVDYLKKRGVKE